MNNQAETLKAMADRIADLQRREDYSESLKQATREWSESGGFAGWNDKGERTYRLMGGKRTTDKAAAIESWI